MLRQAGFRISEIGGWREMEKRSSRKVGNFMVSKILPLSWMFVHRTKIPFLVIFVSVNYAFLKKYHYQGGVGGLLAAFGLQNLALHLLNNYFDFHEDELTGQRRLLTNQKHILSLSITLLIISMIMVWYLKYSLTTFFILLFMMCLYSVPLSSTWRLKKILYVKNLAGSLFWWYLPFTLISSWHTDNSFWQVFLDNTMTLAIFIPFEPLWDIKDTEGDLSASVKTIPNQFGITITKLLVISLFSTIAIIQLKNALFLVTFLFPLILMVLLINGQNKLFVSQILMSYVAMHTFAANMAWPILKDLLWS